MTSWRWIEGLRDKETAFNWSFVIRFSLKVVVFLVGFNLLWIVASPLDRLEQLSLYNSVVPGRPRPGNALSLNELFAASPISVPVPYNTEYRVLFLGDSSIWGIGLRWDHTVPECLNQRNLKTPDGRLIKAFNLAYLSPSMLRDLITMQRAFDYHIDRVVWFISGVGMDRFRMFAHPMLMQNLDDVHRILDAYPIAVPPDISPLPRSNDQSYLLDRTFIGQRAELASWIQSQSSAFVWQQIGNDGTFDFPPRRPRDFENDAPMGDTYTIGKVRRPGDMSINDFLFDAMEVGQSLADEAGVKLTFILEPMWIARPGTTRYRYNEFYPFWYFDLLHEGLRSYATADHWDYQDWSRAIANDEFTDEPFHYTPKAACQLADRLGSLLQERSAK